MEELSTGDGVPSMSVAMLMDATGELRTASKAMNAKVLIVSCLFYLFLI